LWEKNNYFSHSIIEMLRNPSTKYHDEQINKESESIVSTIENEASIQLSNYEKQHKDFCEHSNNQINSIQAQINQIIKQQMQKQQNAPTSIPPSPQSLIQASFNQPQFGLIQSSPQSQTMHPPSLMALNHHQVPPNNNNTNNNFNIQSKQQGITLKTYKNKI
jgi:hypothetical protein